MTDKPKTKAKRGKAGEGGRLETPRRNKLGQLLPGHTANPHGRPKGSRHKLGEEFISALQADFMEHGDDVITKVREDRPEAYLKVIASILPRELKVETTNDLEVLDDKTLTDMIFALKDQLTEGVEKDLDETPASDKDIIN